ncbi:MAG: hypothetical protein AAF654_07935 [Myxococcota bacterium]
MGFRCADGLNACVQIDSDQQGASVLSVTLDPDVVGPRDEVTINVVVSEPLFDVPSVRLPEGSRVEAIEAVGDTEFTYRYEITPEDVPSVVLTIEMFDLSGNSTSETLVTIEIDAVPPVLSNLAWTDDTPLLNPLSRIAFVGEAGIDASVEAELVDGFGTALARVFVGSIPSASGLVLSGAIELSEIDRALLVATGALALRVTATDAVGNTLSETLPLRFLDGVAPETELVQTPGAAPITRDVTFRFDSVASDLASFECRLTSGPFAPCTSPWVPILTSSGPHTVEIRAIDQAGNVDLTPAQHVFEVVAVWQSIGVGAGLAGEIVCGISTDERLWCWGQGAVATGFTADGASSPTLISDERRWREVFVGEDMVCARDANGEFYCWGEGPLGLGLGEEVAYARPVLLPGGPWSVVATALRVRCAIRREGSLWCWGEGEGAGASRGSLEPAQIGVETDWTFVSVARDSACGLRSDGNSTRALCWGRNFERQLGDGTLTPQVDPVEVSVDGIGPVDDWLAVTTGENYACGIRAVTESAGTLWCWGANRGGVLGLPFDADPPDQDVVQVGTATDWTQISLGPERSCGLRADGSAYCWGGSGNTVNGEPAAQLHTLNGERVPAPDAPVAVANPAPWTSIAAGNGFACGLDSDGGLTCWGNNDSGQLGGGVDSGERAPLTPIVDPMTWSDIDVGVAANCGIAAGALYCWGSSGVRSSDRATDGSLDVDRSIPTRVGDADDWLEVSRGSQATCGVRETSPGERTGWCLGTAPLGIASPPTKTESPVQVGTGGTLETGWQSIKPQDDWALGILERNPGERTLLQWGEPPVSTGGLIELPSQIGSDTDWLTIDNRGSFACGVRAQPAGNTLWCWGRASALDLDVDDSELPVQVGVGEPYEFGWESVSGHCGIRDDGSRRTLWCWGYLRDITGGDSVDVPTEIAAPELDVFSRGEEFGCGLDGSGGLWCVGEYSGLTAGGPVFVPVAPQVTWRSLAVFFEHLCALDSDGVAYCAGSDREGERGSGEAWGPFFPAVPR